MFLCVPLDTDDGNASVQKSRHFLGGGCRRVKWRGDKQNNDISRAQVSNGGCADVVRENGDGHLVER